MISVQMPNGETVEFPPGTPPDVMQGAIRSYLAERNSQRGTGERVARTAGMVGQGFNEGLAQTLGAAPDLVASGLRAVGIPTTAPGQYTDWARQGIQYVTGAPQAPETTLERAAQGAGRGIADAASVLVPATAVARGAQAGGVAQGVGRMLAAQPVLQGVAGAVGGAVGDATDNPLLGTAAAIATPVIASAARRAVTPFPMSPERQALADAARREGIPLTAGQATGNQALRYMEGAFESLPTTAGRQQGIADASRRGFNRAVLQRAGIADDLATPDVLAANAQRLGNEFTRLASQTTVQFDAPFVSAVSVAANRYGNKLPSQQRAVFGNYVRDILTDAATGQPRTTLDGAVYQQARSDLTRQVSAYQQNDPALSQALRQLRDALDEVAGRSVPPDMQDAWRAVRGQYSAQRTIERAIGAGENVAEGNISPLLLRNAVNARDRRAYALGRGELTELSRIGQMFMRPMPQSGTAPRAAMMGALTGAGVAGVDPLTLAAGAAVPRAVQEVYMLPPVQRYLQNQALPQGAPSRNALAALMLQQGLSETRAALTNGAR
jgi:hypothetical protein